MIFPEKEEVTGFSSPFSEATAQNKYHKKRSFNNELKDESEYDPNQNKNLFGIIDYFHQFINFNKLKMV